MRELRWDSREPTVLPTVWRSLARSLRLSRALVALAATWFGCAPSSSPRPANIAVVDARPKDSTASTSTDPCGGNEIDLLAAMPLCACSTKTTPSERHCEGNADNESAELVVRAQATQGHIVAGEGSLIDLVLENHATVVLHVDLPPVFQPEIVVFSPTGIRIEPPNGTVACPLHDTARFVSGKVRVAIAPGGRAHALLPWKARSVTWDEARHTDRGRCAVMLGAPLVKGTYELKVISGLLGISSDVATKNPRVKVELD